MRIREVFKEKMFSWSNGNNIVNKREVFKETKFSWSNGNNIVNKTGIQRQDVFMK